ncbi:WD40 repeat domain-containing protein [Nocardiopsis mangrovi]|uniref:WD40 repeat domain-containing protein n=1 Tax=Nocardiopsis mangrovi TaxID=1179818 RepID=A0ABV9DWY8_9ACTN
MTPMTPDGPDSAPLEDVSASDDTGGRLRNLRFLVDRLFGGDPAELVRDIDAHLARQPEDVYAFELRSSLRQEADLLVGHLSEGDLACTLHGRLMVRPSVAAQLRHVGDALPAMRLEHAPPFSPPPPGRQLERVLTGHRAPVVSLDWSPDGRRLATLGSYDTSVRVWDAHTWEQVHVITVPGASLDTVRWSPDGGRIAVVGRSDRFPDAEKKYEPGDEYDFPDITVEQHVHTVIVFDTATWAETAATGTLPKRSMKAPAIAWAPDGRSLAIAGAGGPWLWRFGADEEFVHLSSDQGGPSEIASALAWHPLAGLVALAAGRSLTLWAHPGSSNEQRTWTDDRLSAAHDGLRWRPDGRMLALGGGVALKVVDPHDQAVLWEHDGQERGSKTLFQAATWSADGARLGALTWIDRNPVHMVWEVPRTAAEFRAGMAPLKGSETDLRVDPEHDIGWQAETGLIATGDESCVRIWSSGPGAEAFPRPTTMRTVVWSPDGAALAARAYRNDGWRLVDAENGALLPGEWKVCPFPRLTDEAAAALQRHIDDRAVDDYEHIHIERHGMNKKVTFSPDQKWAVIEGRGEPATVVDVVSGEERRLGMSGIPGASVCFTPDSRRVVRAATKYVRDPADRLARDLIFHVWDLKADTEPVVVRWRAKGIGHIHGLAATHAHLAIVTANGRIGLAELADLSRVRWLKVNGAVVDAAFDPAGKRLAAVGDSGLYVMDVRTGA